MVDLASAQHKICAHYRPKSFVSDLLGCTRNARRCVYKPSMAIAPRTVVEHVLDRLAQTGAEHVFGVPGDYSFPITDAVCRDARLQWVGCSNELNAAYMADGYARVRGIGVLTTTFGVGELSALNGIAGACAERVPVVHLVGMPSVAAQARRAVIHHTLGDGDFSAWAAMSERVSCATSILTVQNAASEVDRCLAAARTYSRPVYLGIPADVAEMPLSALAPPMSTQPSVKESSDKETLHAAVDAILERIASARSSCVLVGAIVVRLGLRAETMQFVDRSGLPFASMWMDKSTLDETHAQFCGMYSGALINDEVRDFVEGCDLVINLGALLSDINTGIYTARLDRMRSVTISRSTVSVGAAVYRDVHMRDVLRELTARCTRWSGCSWPTVHGLGAPVGSGDGPILAGYLFPAIESFLREGDQMFAETGTISMGLLAARMPKGADFINQALWGSVGWAVSAGIGGAFADPTRRTIIVTGEGALQFGPQEMGTAARLGIAPIIIVVNNAGYLTERILCTDPDMEYNDVQPWKYDALPNTFGCEGWRSTRVQTCGQLRTALLEASSEQCGTLIEVVAPRDDMPVVGSSIRAFLQSLRGESTTASSEVK